jgi:hypothetical protein
MSTSTHRKVAFPITQQSLTFTFSSSACYRVLGGSEELQALSADQLIGMLDVNGDGYVSRPV